MEELIRRSDAIRAIAKKLEWELETDMNNKVAEWLNEVPAVEPKQGEWIDVWQDGVCSWRGTCSNCRSTNDIPPPMLAKYCPSCGARMFPTQMSER